MFFFCQRCNIIISYFYFVLFSILGTRLRKYHWNAVVIILVVLYCVVLCAGFLPLVHREKSFSFVVEFVWEYWLVVAHFIIKLKLSTQRMYILRIKRVLGLLAFVVGAVKRIFSFICSLFHIFYALWVLSIICLLNLFCAYLKLNKLFCISLKKNCVFVHIFAWILSSVLAFVGFSLVLLWFHTQFHSRTFFG